MTKEQLRCDESSFDQSVILIKPDGYNSEIIRTYIYELIQEFQLEEVLSYSLKLQHNDVLDIWPKFGCNKYLISQEFSFLYMTSGLSEVIIVTSDNVEQKCSRIKSKVRSRFGTGKFCNCIHTPVGKIETISNLNKFLYSVPNGEAFSRYMDESESPGIWGRLAKISPDYLRETAKIVWNRKEVGGWEALKRSRNLAKFAVRLLPGDPHSIDYGMSVLYETILDWSVEETFCAYLEAEAFGYSTIAEGEHITMQSLSNTISSQGLFTEVSISNYLEQAKIQ
ncbi:hypothetical protein [Nostoc sp. FACHB-190]|uniref:hypothetical protein n=1 Tax=Nostoc sp. FACHB-190 TaxID=2692838 RepID=UPI00168724D4|nr:hypothetical protein [Nostoc sp. FACHB-190]MBD2303813.1 hypothetical protein [Nostoc sp. FACHB-190]